MGDDSAQTVGILGISKRPETVSEPVAEGTDEVSVRMVNQQFFEAIRIDRGDDFEQMRESLKDFSDIMMSIIASRHGGNRG